jgi:hypothetical protein
MILLKMYKSTQTTQSTIPVAVKLMREQNSDRLPLEHFIHDVYAQQYDADVQHFMPVLMGLYGRTGSYLAALGLRLASEDPLFLEQYLAESIEDHISIAAHSEQGEITRSSIVEVGNLAAHHAGGTRWLIIALTAYLQGAGYDWVAFTSVPSLRNSFRKLGLKLYSLGTAQLDSLPAEEQAHWGRYYDSKPQVLAVNVHHTYGVLERLLRFEQALTALQHIWQQSFAFGHASQFDIMQPRPAMR